MTTRHIVGYQRTIVELRLITMTWGHGCRYHVECATMSHGVVLVSFIGEGWLYTTPDGETLRTAITLGFIVGEDWCRRLATGHVNVRMFRPRRRQDTVVYIRVTSLTSRTTFTIAVFTPR